MRNTEQARALRGSKPDKLTALDLDFHIVGGDGVERGPSLS